MKQMQRYDSLPELPLATSVDVGQIRLTNADIEVEILAIKGDTIKVRSLNLEPPNDIWQSSLSYFQRNTKFLRNKEP